MALIKPGPMIAQASGKAGGTIFSRNRGGSYVKRWAMPTNPNTTRQQDLRSTLSMLATYWRNTLTNTQRTAWNGWAAQSPRSNRFGEQITPTGQNSFVSCNQIGILAGNALLPDAPAELGYTAMASIEVARLAGNGTDPNELSIVAPFTGWPNQPDAKAIVWVSAPLPAGRTSMSAASFNTPPQVVDDALAGVPATFALATYGVWEEGDRRVVKVSQVDEFGRISATPAMGIVTVTDLP